uniref:hypothetical protein n=1 Tax=Gelidibacter sp. TaxID=2018083 RepID=UPI004048F382
MNNFKSILSIVFLTILCSCGSKKSTVSQEEFIKTTNSYISEVDTNKNLKTEVTEGVLTDKEGFADIGTFKYTVYFDEKTKELFKIRNVEKTNETVDETYYFKDNKFVFVKFNKQIDGETEFYNGSLKAGKGETLNFYKDKAKRFQKAFKRSH